MTIDRNELVIIPRHGTVYAEPRVCGRIQKQMRRLPLSSQCVMADRCEQRDEFYIMAPEKIADETVQGVVHALVQAASEIVVREEGEYIFVNVNRPTPTLRYPKKPPRIRTRSPRT